MSISPEHLILFGLLLGVFGFLLWGRVRYDLVAFAALILALIVGAVPVEKAFFGFGHPATVIIALVLQHQGNNDCRWMTKPEKCLLHRNRAHNKCQNQRCKRHQVVAHPPPQQESENTKQQTEKNQMFGTDRHDRHMSGDWPTYLGASRMAPSSRITSPFNISLSMMWDTRSANSSGLPKREGKGT